MNISNTVPIIQNNDNETVTLIALPLQIFQQATQQSLIVEQNLLFKTLPDGTFMLDTNQLLNGNSNIALTEQDPNLSNEKNLDTPEQLIYTLQPKSDAPIQTNQTEDLNKVNDDKKSKIRYLHSKSVDARKVGRPRKDSTKTKVTDNNGPFKCKYCDKEFNKFILFKRHEKSHMNEKKYKCPSCPATFNILSNHILHLAIHNKENPTCPECGKKFQRIASLKAHMMYHEKTENFYCEECDLSFNNENDLNEHSKDHGQDKKPEIDTLQCKYCQLTFTNQVEFKKHMSEHNKMRSILQTSPRKKPRKTTTIERKHQCNICSKAFQKRSQIERHMRVHSGEKPYICKICNRGFSQKGSLQIHMTRHTGVRPHKCALCQAKFSQKGNLRAHILKTHSIPHDGQNVFSCTECSCVFKRLGSLNGHMTRNHPKEKNSDIKYVISQLAAMQGNMVVDNDILQQAILKSDLPEVQNQNENNEKSDDTPTATYVTLADLGLDGNMRRYVIKQRRVGDIRWHLCSFCPKEFKKPSDLVRHLRVHTREKPYMCKLCCRSFAVKSTLTTHIRTHTKCTKAQCSHCHKFFSSWTGLKAHALKHTSQKHKCSMCNKSYRSSGKLNQHFQVHLNNHPSYFKEPNSNVIMLQPIQITNKGLQPVLSLRKRPLMEAGSRNRPYTCKVCGAAFRRLSHLKQHHIKHTGERPFRCHLCYRNFASNSILKNHILTHNGTKPYKCVICQKNFSTNGSLKRHLESHSNAKPFLCPYCFRDFKNILQCRKHMTTHNIELNVEMETNDQCELTDDLSYPPDLADTLVDDPFSLVQPLSQPSLDDPDQQIDEVHTSNSLVTQTLRADESGTVVLPVIANQENLTQENMREIEDTLNSQMLNIIGNENFVDSSTYINKINASGPIPTTDELVNTLSGASGTEKTIEDNPFLYHQVIVNLNPESEQMPIFDNNGIENILSQVKLQNESLFLTDLNSLNINNINETNNVLLPFQIAPQQDLQQNQLIMLPPEIEQEIQSSALNSSVSLDNIDQNLQLKLNAINGFLDPDQNITDTNIAIETRTEFLNSEEDIVNDTIPTKTIENSIIADVITTDNQVTAVIPADIITEAMDITCNLCKLQFKTKNDLKIHQCLNFINVEVSSPDISTNIDTVETDNSGNVPKEVFDGFISQKEKDPLESKKPTPVYKNTCTYCPKTFRKPSDLQRHLRTHTGERPFKCDECAKSFSLKSTLESHSKIHQGRKEFTCHVCNCLFATKGSLSVHMRLHTGIKPFKCPLCQLKFRTSGHRKAHLTVHFKEALRTGKTPSDIVTRKAKMTELMEGVQNMIDLDLTGKQTEKESDSQIPLENISVGPSLQITQPVVDNIVLQTDEKPLMHFEIETNTQGQIINIKPTASNIVFVDETSKEEIISTQVEFDEKTKLQIENFLRDKKAKQHEVKHRIKKVCNVCNKEFGTKYLLDRHSKIHTGERIFSCNYCSKTFNQKNALQAHVRTHLGSKPFCCPFCWNTFSQSGNLKTHMKRIHSGNLQNKDIVNSGLITTDILQADNLAR